MSESRRASSSSGSDPLASLPAGASLDPKTGAIIQPTEDSSSSSEGSRRAWMNSASRHAIAREAGKGNWGKWAATGAGFVLGGVAIGLTGGLAAPVLVPALAGLTGAGFLATSGGVVLVGTLFGLGGGGLAGYRVRRRLRGVDSFEFEELPNAAREAGLNIPSLHATICVSGLLLEPQEQIEPWAAGLGNTKDGRDAFAVRCETDLFVEAGKGLRSYVLDQLLRTGGQKAAEQVLKHTAFAAFAAITYVARSFASQRVVSCGLAYTSDQSLHAALISPVSL